MSWNETGSWAHQLVNTDNFAWLLCLFELAVVDPPSFSSPRLTMGFSILATGALWWWNVSQVFRNESCLGEPVEHIKGHVSQLLMKSSESQLFLSESEKLGISLRNLRVGSLRNLEPIWTSGEGQNQLFHRIRR